MKQTLLLIVLSLFICTGLYGQKVIKSNTPVDISGWKEIDINSVKAAISYDGVFGDYRKTNSSGIFWPKGTNNTAVYTSGLWIIGKHKPTDSLRTAVMCYGSEFQPGKILSTFNTTTNFSGAADDPSKPEYRLYKIVRGIMGEDYENWPVHLGAPFNDVNNNGVWDKGTESPVRWGDQQLWTVSNDANPSTHANVGTTNPMGIELQSTFFAYDVPGAPGNTVFLRYKIINKSDAEYDSVYISYWSDTDMGDANDDVSAVDTLRNLLYVFNGDDQDAGESGYGAFPPATGFILLQGPLVYTGNTNDTGRIEGKTKVGYKNLPITSHSVYFGGGVWSDPPLRSPNFARQAYNYQKGLIGPTGTPFINPETSQPIRFVFPGDPVTNTGWTQSTSGFDPGDIRSMLSTGPLTLAQGDTQEIVVAFTIAQAGDRLSSITLLRNYADVIREVYRSNFTLPLLFQQSSKMYLDFPSNALSFGKVNLGEMSDTISLRIANIGTDTLVLNFGTLSNSSFIRTAPPGISAKIAGGNSIAVQFLFKPLTAGDLKDSIVITSNDSVQPAVNLFLSGVAAQVNAVAPGFLYATNGMTLFTVSSTAGFATQITGLEPGSLVSAMAVRPSTKELTAVHNGGMTRISANTASHIPYQYSFSGYSIGNGAAFTTDTTLIFAGDSIIGRVNINTGKIDTVHRFLQTYRIQSMAYNSLTNDIFFSIRTTLNVIPDTSDVIFKINASTREVTRLGRTKIGIHIRSLLFDKNGKLYGLVDSSAVKPAMLITIDTGTGLGTLVGSTGVYGLFALAMDPGSVAHIQKNNAVVPENFLLYQNYPNPFNPTTVISYHVPSASPVTLEMFDILGRKIATLVNAPQEAGQYAVRVDISSLSLSSGIYLYKLQSGDFMEVKKMSVVK